MAELNHEEQIDVVRRALALETALQVESDQIKLVKNQKFDYFPSYQSLFVENPPAEPVRKKVPIPKPVVAAIPAPPKANYTLEQHLKKQPYLLIVVGAAFLSLFFVNSFLGVLLMLPSFSILPLLIYFVYTWFREKKRQNEELANSPEYLARVAKAQQDAIQKQAQIDTEVAEHQKELDAQFDKEQKHYHEVLLPAFNEQVNNNKSEYEKMKIEYQEDKNAWEAKRSKALSLLEKDVQINSETLDELYATSQIISLHYRSIPILQWLYDDMSSSDHDIRYATELLDRDRQRIATEESGMRITTAIERFEEQAHQDAKALGNIQLAGMQNLEAVASDNLRTNEDIALSNSKTLFHQRVNTADIALREWRRHKVAKKSK